LTPTFDERLADLWLFLDRRILNGHVEEAEVVLALVDRDADLGRAEAAVDGEEPTRQKYVLFLRLAGGNPHPRRRGRYCKAEAPRNVAEPGCHVNGRDVSCSERNCNINRYAIAKRSVFISTC
jgi:hypothetical protein